MSHRRHHLSRPTVCLHGSARSGTTWLAQLLARPFRHRLLFEPFHPDAVPEASIVADRWVDPETIPDDVATLCFRALDDRVENRYVQMHTSHRFGMHRRRWWPKLRVVKDVRTNLLVPALRALFGPSLPIVLLVRHPGAVVESLLRKGFSFGPQVDHLLAQETLADVYGLPLDDLARLATSEAKRIAVRWLIENRPLLDHASALGLHVVRFEALAADPDGQALRLLFTTLGIAAPAALGTDARRGSATADQGLERPGATAWTDGWRQRLDPRIASDVEHVLEVGGFDLGRFESSER